ncbi:MAG: hypothetical protein ACOC1K_05105, partial [Nanoarchaeota archaeon]
MQNKLVNGNINEKIAWYIKAHGHSSIGGLNLILAFFDYNGNKEIASKIKEAINLFKTFSNSDDIKVTILTLEQKIEELNQMITNLLISKEKKQEIMDILDSVNKNITRIQTINQNPGYEERFKISD